MLSALLVDQSISKSKFADGKSSVSASECPESRLPERFAVSVVLGGRGRGMVRYPVAPEVEVGVPLLPSKHGSS